MKVLDIVYCYVSEEVTFIGSFSDLQNSFRENGFVEKQVSDTVWKYTRGAGLALEFNYDSEAIQMQVFLERPNNKTLIIKVGNWGFPFEPLMMKKRFKKNLSRMVAEIEANNVLSVNKSNVQGITQDAKKKKKTAILVIFAAVVGLVIYEVVTRL